MHHHQERTPDSMRYTAVCISLLHAFRSRARCHAEWGPMLPDFRLVSTVRASSPPFPIPWRVIDGGMKITAMIHFRASKRYMTKQVKPTKGTDGLGQRWTFSVDKLIQPIVGLPQICRRLQHTANLRRI